MFTLLSTSIKRLFLAAMFIASSNVLFPQSNSDTSTIKTQRTGLDSTVTYTSRDSTVFSLKKRTMYLKGDAEISLKQQILQAESIEIDFKGSIVKAEGKKDSLGKKTGYPIFEDNGEEFTGERILFNLETRKGTITLGESKADEGGYYYGSKVKKESDNTLFIQNGCYTTCTQPHPHFYFGASKMKVVTNDRVFMENISFVVEDVPIITLPLGIYVPNKTGRTSGLIFNIPFVSTTDGIVAQNLGYFWAINDYMDAQFTTDVFSKTGYLLRNAWRYSVQNNVNGAITFEYGRRRKDAQSDYVNSWRISGNHQQTISPQSRITASFNVASSAFINRFASELSDRLTQSLFSNAGYSSSFDNGTTLGIDIAANQNIVTKEYSVNPNISYNVPTFFPLKALASGTSWLQDIGVSYFVRGAFSHNAIRSITKNSLGVSDTLFTDKNSSVIRHNPSISVSPKLGYFSLTPGISYSENWYFRSLRKSMNLIDSTITESIETSAVPLRETQFQASLGIGTRLFGLMKPRIFGINAVRHTFSPTVSVSYIPEYSSLNSDNIRTYRDIRVNKDIEYSRFELDGGRGANRGSTFVNYSLSNRFEAKMIQGDTADKNVDLLQLDISGSYAMALDSLNWSAITMGFRTPSIGSFNLNGNAGFTLYDEEKNAFGSIVPINALLIERNKGLARLTFASVNLSAQFASGTMSIQSSKKDTSEQSWGFTDDRFAIRNIDEREQVDYYGERGIGGRPLQFPWSMSTSVTYYYGEPIKGMISRRFDARADIDLKLTSTLNVRSTFSYDFINAMIVAPSISIVKDLDCWELSANWYPTGFNQGFIIRFAAKASQLRDLQLIKRNLPVFR
ncbi:MAG: LPS-assembly protein LptD [Bacteroidetes bacterium]|nr:LPS-assembly protein LptD [bacterium]NBP63325.1 LPS-assembly protein LptD [Bacteroidota bacterium]